MRPAPDIATALYCTGVDPFTKKPAAVARGMRDRKMPRALMQFLVGIHPMRRLVAGLLARL